MFVRLPTVATVAATLALLGAAGLSTGVAPALAKRSATARARDAAATRTYVKANYALVSTARSNLAAAKEAIDNLATQVAGECPLVAAQAPQNHDAEQLSDEVVGALELAAYQPDKSSMLTFAQTVRSLHWTNRKLTRMVQAYAVKLTGFPTLTAPSICADVSAWTASSFRTLSPATVAFDAGFERYDIEAEEVRLRLLRPYESATEASLLRRTKRLESPLAEFEAEAVSDYSKILDALKLPQ